MLWKWFTILCGISCIANMLFVGAMVLYLKVRKPARKDVMTTIDVIFDVANKITLGTFGWLIDRLYQ